MVLRLTRRALVFPDLSAASATLGRRLAALASTSVGDRGRFSLVISGGRTPTVLYRLLGGPERRRFPWAATEVFFADERCVPPRHPDSNFGAAWATFLSRVPIPRHQVHRMRGELRPPSEAAKRYATLVGPVASLSDAAYVRFDVVLLGIGADGHTASLFPGSPAVRERRRTVVSVVHPGLPPLVPRLTLTPPALSSARDVWFLVSGADKAAAVSEIFGSGPEGSLRYPASRVRPPGGTSWFLDRAAAAALPTGVRGHSAE